MDFDLGDGMVGTTKAQFELFKSECLKWVNHYGLHRWSINFTMSDSEDHPGSMGTCWASLDNMCAVINLAPEYHNKLSKEDIKETAWHEATELLMMPLYILSTERYVSPVQLDEARHAIIQTLQKITYNPYAKGRKI